MKKIKTIGFLKQAYGDIVMQTAVIKAFKYHYPDSYFVMGIDKKYSQISPLLLNHPQINEIHIWDGEEDWPNKNDIEYIDNNRFDYVFPAMRPHLDLDWYNKRHYITEFTMMAGLKPIGDQTCYLNDYFDLYKDCNNIITLSMFPSFDKGQGKSLSISQLEELCINIKKLGFRIIQLGGKFEQKLQNSDDKPDLNLFDSVRLMRSSKLNITADCFYSWCASAYLHPTIGIYTNNLPMMENSWSHRPYNQNAYYFHRENLLDLQTEEIIDKIKEFLV